MTSFKFFIAEILCSQMAFFIEKYKTAYDNCNGDEKLLNELKEKITASLKHCDESSNNLTDEQSTPVSPTQKATVTANSDSLLSFSLGNDVTLEMIRVKAGTFMMGSQEDEFGHRHNEKLHKVTLTQDYWLGKFPVTQAQFQAIRRYNPSHFCGSKRPVECVTWDSAREFCVLLNKKFEDKLPEGYQFDLPTEAQWEYACRAGTTTAYFWGDADDDSCTSYNTYTTTDVGSFRANAWGFYNMHGNVREWCRDWYANYKGTEIDPTGPFTGLCRVYRGGSWSDNAKRCRSASRDYGRSDTRQRDIGFRLALVPV